MHTLLLLLPLLQLLCTTIYTNAINTTTITTYSFKEQILKGSAKLAEQVLAEVISPL